MEAKITDERINEAITLLGAIKESRALQYNPEHRDACQLGIEALKLIKEADERLGGRVFFRLPGETEK